MNLINKQLDFAPGIERVVKKNGFTPSFSSVSLQVNNSTLFYLQIDVMISQTYTSNMGVEELSISKSILFCNSTLGHPLIYLCEHNGIKACH